MLLRKNKHFICRQMSFQYELCTILKKPFVELSTAFMFLPSLIVFLFRLLVNPTDNYIKAYPHIYIKHLKITPKDLSESIMRELPTRTPKH